MSTQKSTQTTHDRLMDAWLDAEGDYAKEKARQELDRHVELMRLISINGARRKG